MSSATRVRDVAVGVFADRAQAQQAVNELKRNGFTESQIGVASRHSEEHSADESPDGESMAAEGAATGIAAGAGLGALWGIGILAGMVPGIGPAIAGGTLGVLLSSAAAGAAAAGVAGAMIGLGISEEEATFYEEEFTAGRTIVTVRTSDGGVDLAQRILDQFGGYDMASQRGTPRQPR